jgi:hypothetical protein
MSQAEHDPMASAILLTTSEKIADETVKELYEQIKTLSRKEIIEQSLDHFGAVIICKDLGEAVDFANELAPEHLELCAKNPMEYLGSLDNWEAYSSEIILRNHWAIILQAQIMCSPPAERLVSFLLFLWTVLSKNQVSFIIQKMLWSLSVMRLLRLLKRKV